MVPTMCSLCSSDTVSSRPLWFLLSDKALTALTGDMGKPFGASTQERAGEKILCCSSIKSCPTLCDPMNCSTSGFSVLHDLSCSNSCPTSQWCYSTSSSATFFSFGPQSFLASGSFPMSQLFTIGGAWSVLELQLRHESVQWEKIKD